MKLREALRKLVGGFKKTSNKNMFKQVVDSKENRLTPESFTQLVMNNKVNSKTKCAFAINSVNTLSERQAKGIEVLIKLETIVDILDELTATEIVIENIDDENWMTRVNYTNDNQYSLVYDSTALTGPEVIKKQEEKIENLSNQLIEAYTELYEITDGGRYMLLSAEDCKIELHGLLVLIERILKNDAFNRVQDVETLKYLVDKLVFAAQPYVDIRKRGFNSETEKDVSMMKEDIEKAVTSMKEAFDEIQRPIKEYIEIAL